jgi:uncharacterized protein DUF222/HNH endonuclease
MTVTQLRAPESVSGALVEAVAAASRLVGEAAAAPVGRVSTDALAEAVAGLAVVESQTASLRLALSAEADRRRVAERTAHTGTDAWLAALTGETRELVRGGLALARALQERYAATREAFAAGRLRLAQVRVIVHAADQSPAEATPAQVRAAEEWLVAKATGDGTRSGRPMNARRLRQAARRMFDPVDTELADRHEAILLGREHRRAEAETFLALHDNGDGTFSGRFLIPELHGQLLRRALDRLTAPRRLSRDRHGRPVVDESAPGTGCGANIYQVRGAAFCELIEHLPARGHTANGVRMLVKLDLEALLTGLGVAGIETGAAISAGEARRLACNAGLVPAVLGGASVPLDLGRERRLHTGHQRRALAVVHDTCAVTGCDRPFAWCEIHHPRPWSAGGRTDVANAIPLCGWHHRRAHDDRWDLRRHADGDYRFHRRR